MSMASGRGETGEGGVISIFARLLHEHKPLTVFGDGQQTWTLFM